MSEGDKLKKEGMGRAARHANPAWMEARAKALVTIAQRQLYFTTDDVAAEMERASPNVWTHENKAAGAVSTNAVRAHIMEDPLHPTVKCKRKQCHSGPIREWRSLIFNWRDRVKQRSNLREYQQKVIKFLYEHDAAFAVLKMGAGKTISTLSAIEELIGDRVIRHALIVAPKRVATLVWPAEIAGWEHTKKLSYAVLDGGPMQRLATLLEASGRDITIIGIDNVQWLVDELVNLPADHPLFDCLVIDETSRLKDPKSKRAKALASISRNFAVKWGLTGTPRPNSLLDLYMPARIISDGTLFGRSYYKFRKENFYPTDYNGYDWQVLPDKEKAILATASSIAITLAEDDMPELPRLSYIVDDVRLPEDARRTYRDMERRLFTKIGNKDILAVSRAVATGKLAQIANGFAYDAEGAEGTHRVHEEKSSWLKELVDGLDGEPTILVYEYKEDLAMIRRLFGDIPYLGAGIVGKTAKKHVDDWNLGKLPLLALHPASGGHGLNLQFGGSRMAWVGPTWSAELWDQTIARIHRPGQSVHCMVHCCVATDTVDDLKRLRVISKLSAQRAFEVYLAKQQELRDPRS